MAEPMPPEAPVMRTTFSARSVFILFKFKFGPLFGVLTRFQFVGELFFADFGKELAHGWTRLHTHGEQVVAGQQRRANFGLFFKFLGLLNQIVVNVQTAMRADAIEAMKL